MSITYHVCKYTPTELLTALGGQCALLDEAPENFDLSDQVAHPNLCGFGKSVIQAALAGQVKELVLVNCCDTIRSAYDILKEFGNLDFLYLLDILHSQEGCSVQHARDQLLALAEAYRAYKGTQFDRAAFFAAFQSPPLVTGPHIAVLGAKMGSHLFSLVEETMPLPVENATCAIFSAAGFADMSVTFSAPLVIITRAVMVSTTKVSMNTQIMATIPWS